MRVVVVAGVVDVAGVVVVDGVANANAHGHADVAAAVVRDGSDDAIVDDVELWLWCPWPFADADVAGDAD